MEIVEKYLGREIVKKETIKIEGTFESFYAAEAKLRGMGYVVGSMCASDPIGFADGDEYDYISKWHNLNPVDRKFLDGVMISDGWREGSVTIIWFATPKDIE
jgi:hypothetical protein